MKKLYQPILKNPIRTFAIVLFCLSSFFSFQSQAQIYNNSTTTGNFYNSGSASAATVDDVPIANASLGGATTLYVTQTVVRYYNNTAGAATLTMYYAPIISPAPGSVGAPATYGTSSAANSGFTLNTVGTGTATLFSVPLNTTYLTGYSTFALGLTSNRTSTTNAGWNIASGATNVDNFFIYTGGVSSTNNFGGAPPAAFYLQVYGNAVTNSGLGGTSFCAGTAQTLTFFAAGAYNAGNTFTAQLSDASGNFGAPVTIGTLSSTTTGSQTMSITIPGGTAAGSGYKIRVNPSNPSGITGEPTPTAFTISNGLPPTPGTITQPANECANASGIFSIAAVTGATSYTWLVTGPGWGITAGGTTTSATITIGTGTGTVSVKATNACGTSTTASTTGNITPSTAPLPPGTITQPGTICASSTGNIFSIASVSGATSYTWSTTGSGWGVTAGGTTTSATITAGAGAGSVFVTATNACGTSTASTTGNITPTPIPATPGTITQPPAICASSTGNVFSIAAVPGATSYTWSVSGGGWAVTAGGTTTSATITIGAGAGSVSVTASNGTCSSIASTTGSLTPTTAPAQPGAITGTTAVCAGSSQTYSVTNVGGVTYTWNIPGTGWSITAGQGTNSVTYTVGTASGTVQVTPSNGCGNGTAQTLPVTVTSGIPATPGTITQPTNKCAGSTGNIFSIASVAGAVSYTWSVVGTGWAVTAGGTTTSATITIGSIAGSVSVTATNVCGTSAASTTGSLTPTTVPAVPGTITQPSIECASTTGNIFSISAVPGATSYTWSVTGTGWAVTAGGTTASATITLGTGVGSVSVSATNACGTGSQSTTGNFTPTAIPAQPSTITGTTPVCAASSQTYSVTNVAGITYTWTIPAGWSITAGQGTNSVTYTVGTTSGTVQVTPSNACGNGTARTLPVTVNTAASITTPPVSQTKCAGSSVTFSVVAGGTTPTYQWRKNGTNIGGATSSSYTIAAVAAADAANYDVVVTVASCGSVTSSVAILTVNPLPTGTVSGTTSLCQNAASPNITFTGANGTAPYTFTYNINGGSSQNISTTAGNSITIAVSTTTAGTYAYNLVSVQDASSTTCSQTQSSTAMVTVNALPTFSSITASPATICSGSVSTITATTGFQSLNGTLGTGTATTAPQSTTNNLGPNPFETYYGGAKEQMLVTAAELTGMGFSTGSVISAMQLQMATVDGTTLQNVNVKMELTALTAVTGTFVTTGLTTVYTATNYNPTAGYNNFPFGTNFTWDGTSNLLIEINYTDNIVGSGTNTAYYTPTSFLSTAFYRADSKTAAQITATTAATFTYSSRNNLTFSFTAPPAVTWLPVTELYTNLGATTAYSAGTNFPVVYEKGTATRTYTATATTASGCTATGTVMVNVNPLPVVSITGSATICAGTTTTLSPTTGGTWVSSDNTIATVTNAGIVTGVAAGTATFTFTQTSPATGCTSTTSAVTVNPLPSITPAATAAAVCFSTTAQTTTLAYTGATNAPTTYSITWSASPANSFVTVTNAALPASPIVITVPANTAPGTYTGTITVKNANGCVSSSGTNFTITVNGLPSITPAASAAAVCFSTTAQTSPLTYTAATNSPTTYSITWSASPANSFVAVTTAALPASPITINVPANTAAGTYTGTISVQNANGCASSAGTNFTITVNPLPVVSITGPNPICAGFTTTLSPSTAGTWVSNNTSVATVNATTGVVTGVATTTGTATFTFTITATGCVNTTSALTVNALPVVAAITDGATNICVNSITQFTDATSGGTWSVTNGTGTATIDATGTVTGVTAGNVTVNYTYSNGTCTNVVTKPLTIDAQPAISPVVGGATTVCVNAQTPAFTDATSGGTWSIINGTGSASITTGGIVTGLTAGSVTVLYTTNNLSCTNEAGVSLTVNPLPPVAAIAGGAPNVCVNGSIPAYTDATSGGTWAIVNGTGSATITAGGVVTPVTAGNVMVTYTVNNGTCSNTASQALTIDPIPSVAAIGGGAPSVCLNGLTPAFTDATSGGTWSITNGSGTASINPSGVVTGLTAGTVTVVYTVTNTTCSNTATISLIVNPLPIAGAITGASTVCAGSTITLTSHATGTGTLTYTWASSNTSFATVTNAGVVTGVAAGAPGITYTVSDGNGCTATSPNYAVTVNARPTATITSPNATVCNDGTNTINITGTVTANGPWTLTLNSGGSATGSGNGTFSISVTPTTSPTTTYTISSLSDANCTSTPADLSGSTVVTVNKPVNINVQPTDQSVCVTTAASFFVNATGTGVTYTWYKGVPPGGTLVSNNANITGATTSTLHFNQAALSDTGYYYAIAAGLSPCAPATSDTAHLKVSQTINITLQPASQIVCTGSNVMFTVTATAGSDFLAYKWLKNGSTDADANISRTDSTTFIITGATAANAANYSVVITDTITGTVCATAYSSNASLTVNPIPTATIGGTVTVCQGGTAPNISFTNPQALPVTITYNVNGSGTTTINVPASSSATTGAPTGTPGVFTYNLVSIAYQAAPACTNTITGSATVTVNPTPTASISGTTTVCQGGTAPNIIFTNPQPLPVTVTYNINGGGTTTVNVPASSTATVTAPTGTAGVFNYNLVSVAYQSAPGCSAPITGVATVTVNPTPTATISGTTSLCQGSAAPNITFTNPQSLAVTITYNINGTGTTTINVASNSTATVTVPTGTAGSFAYNLVSVAYQSAPGCSTTISGSATVTVKPTPTVSATNTTQTICSGTPITNIVITNPNIVAGTTFAWLRDNTTNLTGVTSGSGSPISGTITNITNAQQITNFTITATANGCSSSTTAVITVNPTPVMTSASTGEVCNHATITIPLTSTVTSTYTWIAANNTKVTGESTTTQTTSTLSNTLNNISAIPPANGRTPRQPVVYTVTPTSTAGCIGTPQTVTVTVNPHYSLSYYDVFTNPASADSVQTMTICDGNEVGGGNENDLDLYEGDFTGTTDLWQYSVGSPGPWTPIPGPHINTGQHDTLPDPPSVFSNQGTYYFRLLLDGCTSDTLTLIISSTLKDTAGTPNTTVCESGAPSPITLSGANVTGTASTTVGGTWSIASLSPTNGSNQGTLSNTGFITTASGLIPTVTYTPPIDYAGVVTLTLTSDDPDGVNNPCIPLTATRTITITQAPIISNPSTMSICSGSGTNITLASVIPSTYTWTVGAITGGITGATPTSGSGATINQVLTNPSSTVAGTVTYSVTPTPTSPAGCAAITAPITVTVNPAPAPTVAKSPTTNICQGSTATLTATNTGGTLTGTLSGSNYNQQVISIYGTTTILDTIILPTSPTGTINASDITFSMDIDHTATSDLTVTLISPSCGQSVIFNQVGGTVNLGGVYTFNSTSANTFPGASTGTGASQTYNPGTYKASFAGITFPCANASGVWVLKVVDNYNLDGGTLNSFSLSINTHGVYSSVFSGPASIGGITYSGATNTGASVVVTPPTGTNNYTVATTDPYGCTGTSAPIAVVVNPTLTLSGATTTAVCAGSPAIINLTGLVANSIDSITYKIGSGPIQTAIVTATGTTGSFTTRVLTSADNGLSLVISSIAYQTAPNCSQSPGVSTTLVVNPTPTLSGAVQATAVCPGSTATINLTGLVSNSTSTITYTINGGPVQTVTGVVATGTTASFATIPLTFANNGQTLQITSIAITSATPGCTASFTTNLTLSVNVTPILTSTLTPPAVCSGNTFGYTPTSSVTGTTYAWTRAAVGGISQPTSSGTGGISEQLTNTTNSSINVTYVYTLTANGCSNIQNVVVSVSPSPTTTSVGLTQTGAACAGSGGNFTITGLTPNITATLYYTVNNGPLYSVTVTANTSGTATFVSTNLILSNNGQIIKITGVSGTACIKSVTIVSLISVNPVPTLTGATAAMVCPSGPATVNLSGLVLNSTNNTINYTINGVAQPAVTGVNADASGNAAFNTTALTPANNGQTLTITGITNGTCSSSFTQNIVLSVSGSYTWLGVDNNWFNPANWCGGVPTITSNVLIPIVGTNLYPILTTGNGYTNTITIQSGASVTVSTGGILTINAAITNNGTFNVSTGKIELNGTAAQTIAAATFTTNFIQDLVVSNTAGVNLTGPLNVTGSITYGVANGILNTNGNLTLKSSITQTAYLGDMTNHTINGAVTVERYIATGSGSSPNHGKSWQLLATPTQGQTIKQSWMEGATAVDGAGPYPNAANPNPGYGTMTTSDLSATVTNQPTPGFDAYTPTGGPSMKVYNGATNAYIGVTSTALPIYNAAGYFVFVRGDRSVYTSPGAATPTILRSKGTLFTPANPPPSSTVTAGKFQSVGNPYAAPLDIRNITLGGGTQQFFQVWDPRLGGAYNYGAFQTLSKIGADFYATPGGGSYGSGPVDYIQSGQAFIMQAFGSNGTVSFSEAAKAGSSFSGTIFARPGSGGTDRNASVPSTLSTLRTTLHNVNTDGSTGGIVDGVLSQFDDSYSNDVDGLDARKTANTGENLSIMTSGKLLSIESRHTIVQNDTIFLNITRERALPYQFSFDAQNLSGTVTSGFVEDTYLKTRTPLNLSGNTVVNFTVANIAGSYAADRFRIVFSPLKVLPVTFTSIKAYKSDKNINVEWKVDNERNIKQYEVEKSVNGRDFSMLEVVKPTANNGSSAVYVLPDTKPVTGYNYYRVRSIDINGSISYSTVVNVLIDAIKQDININPNPITDGQIHLQFMNEPAGKYGIRLLNKLGQVIIQKQITREDGTTTEFIKWDFNLAHGMYQLEVTKPDGSLKDINVLY